MWDSFETWPLATKAKAGDAASNTGPLEAKQRELADTLAGPRHPGTARAVDAPCCRSQTVDPRRPSP